MPPPCSNPAAPAACTPVDIPTGWDPRADCLPCLRQGRPVPGCGYPASASCLERHSRLADRCPSLGSLFPPQAAVASAANPAVKTKKDQYTNVYWSFLVGAAGFEPTASSSRTRRATNCAMPRKYRSRLGCGLVGDERIELPQVESESTALPLCKSPLFGLSGADRSC